MNFKRSLLFPVVPALLMAGCSSAPGSGSSDTETACVTAPPSSPLKFEFQDSISSVRYPDGSVAYTIENRLFLVRPIVDKNRIYINHERLKLSETALIDLGSLFNPDRTIELTVSPSLGTGAIADCVNSILHTALKDTEFASETNLHKIITAARLGDREAWLAVARIVADSYQKALAVTNYRVVAFNPQTRKIIIHLPASEEVGEVAFEDLAYLPLGSTMLEGFLRDASDGNVSLTTLKPTTGEARYFEREFKRVMKAHFSDDIDKFMEEFNQAAKQSLPDSIQ